MSNNRTVEELSTEEIEFIAAVVTDDVAELALDDDEEYVLFTDYEGDGRFLPTVDVYTDFDEVTEQEIEDKITDLLEDYDWFIVDEYDAFQYHNNGSASLYFYNPRIRESVRDAVADSL